MAAIARGLAAKPKVLITDEPALGLAEVVARRLYAAIKELNNRGRTIVLIEENPARALQISHRIVRVERGIAEQAIEVSAAALAESQAITEAQASGQVAP
jgi:branched-chain amino acid transport system ATP-binding protein